MPQDPFLQAAKQLSTAPATAAPTAPTAAPSTPDPFLGAATSLSAPPAAPVAPDTRSWWQKIIDAQPHVPVADALRDTMLRTLATHNPRELLPGAKQGRVALTSGINALSGAKGGLVPMAMNAALGEAAQDENWQGALGGLAAGTVLSPAVKATLQPGAANGIPLPIGWKRAALGHALDAGGFMGGYLGGTLAGGNPLPAAQDLGTMGLVSLLHVLHGARQASVTNTPGAVSERMIQDGAKSSGRPASAIVGDKNRTTFSGLGGDQMPMPGPGGAAAMPASGNIMQSVMDHLSSLAGKAAAGARATPQATGTANPMAGIIATLAKKVNGDDEAPKGALPADVAPGAPEPPRKGGKIKANEPSRPVVAGPGGQPVPPAGPGPVPGDVPPAPNVAPPNAGVGRGYGSASSVSIPESDTSYPVRYRVRELGELIPSHNADTFEYNPKYPYDNERDYSVDANQPRVIENSKPGKFQHARVINDSPDATIGPPITSAEGHVMGGNNRTMLMQRAFRDPATAAAYRTMLEQKAAQFGIDPAELKSYKNPVLVREMNPGAVSKANAPDIIGDLNVDPNARKSLEEQAIADAKRMKPEHWDRLGRIVEEMPEDQTMRGILGDPQRGPGIIHWLKNTGLFKENELGNLLDSKTGAVTAAAKDRIENMLVGRAFRDPGQMANTPAEVKAKISRAAGSMARLRNYPDWDVTHMLPDAINAMEEGRVKGFANLGDMNKQADFEGNTAGYDDATLALADAMKKRGPVQFANKMKEYLGDAEVAHGAAPANMFGPGQRTLEQAFSHAFDAPRGLKPAPRAVRAPKPLVEPEATAPAAEPAAAPAPAVDHADVAEKLNEHLKNLQQGRRDLNALGDHGIENVQSMLEGARKIPEEDFRLLFKRRYAQGKGRTLLPADQAAHDAALARTAQTLGIEPASAGRLGDALAMIHTKLNSSKGGDIARWNEGEANAVPLKATLDKLAGAVDGAKAAPAVEAPPAPAPAPVAAPAPPPAEAPKPAAPAPAPAKGAKVATPLGSRTVEDWEKFLGGRFSGTRHGATISAPESAPLPGAASLLGTAGLEPAVQRAVTSSANKAATELASSTQSPAARTGGPVPPPAPLPVATKVAGTAGFESGVQNAEEADYRAKVESRQKNWEQFVSGTQGPEARTNRTADAATPPAATEALGTVGYDTRPQERNPGKTMEERAAEAKAKAAADRVAAKAAAKAAAVKAKPTDQQMLDELLGKAYDGAKRTFPRDLAARLAEHERKNPGTLDRATGGNGKQLRDYADNLTAVWDRWGRMVEPSGQPKGIFRAWLEAMPKLFHGVRVGVDLPHPMNQRAAQTQVPTSNAYATMKYLATHPDTPLPYVKSALSAIASTDRERDK